MQSIYRQLPGRLSLQTRGQQTLAHDDVTEHHEDGGGLHIPPPPPRRPNLPQGRNSPLNFRNSREVYQHKSSYDLVRSLLVFQSCRWPWLVNNADKILATSKSLLGSYAVNAVVSRTFFEQFCAGKMTEVAKNWDTRLCCALALLADIRIKRSLSLCI